MIPLVPLAPYQALESPPLVPAGTSLLPPFLLFMGVCSQSVKRLNPENNPSSTLGLLVILLFHLPTESVIKTLPMKKMLDSPTNDFTVELKAQETDH